MNILKKTIAILLSAVLLSTGLAVYAADDTFPSEGILDPAWLESRILEYAEQNKLNPDNLHIAYCYTGTGETWTFNADEYITGASLYKLPLLMEIADLIDAGELDENDTICNWDIPYIMERCLTYSDNPISEELTSFMGAYGGHRHLIGPLAGIPEEEIPDHFYHDNTFSANMMLRILEKLYSEPERYSMVISCLKNASPNHYFRSSMEERFEIAQKYGSISGYMHTAGIIYTPTPCLAVVMTHLTRHADTVIGDIGAILADYTLELDKRLAEKEAAGKTDEPESKSIDAADAEEAPASVLEASETDISSSAPAQTESPANTGIDEIGLVPARTVAFPWPLAAGATLLILFGLFLCIRIRHRNK